MSDLSVLEQSFGLPPATMMPLLEEPPLYAAPPVSADVQPHEVNFRRLRGAHEIARILHLRDEIQLPASAVGDSAFATREKKETKSAWSVLSCGSVNTSVLSGCCR